MEKYQTYKSQIVECTQWLSNNGYFGALRGTGGNVSMRIEGEDAFAITPSSLPYDQLQPDDICILDFDMKPIEGERQPSVESGFHLVTYKNRAKINAVVHTHQVYASIFAILNRPIPPLFDEVSLHLGTTIDVIPYALSGSSDLVENATTKLGNMCNAYLIQNHGALCMASTLEKAWLNVELLEKTARIYYGALSIGGEVSQLPEEIVGLLDEIRKAE
ncbi:MAG: class II aldolase/adducin family protein [Proteobacteria bacterium]|nr:class II aldolase/adducin family protein [Pseudomonadota bacterium]